MDPQENQDLAPPYESAVARPVGCDSNVLKDQSSLANTEPQVSICAYEPLNTFSKCLPRHRKTLRAMSTVSGLVYINGAVANGG
jgi:hypothetical protein